MTPAEKWAAAVAAVPDVEAEAARLISRANGAVMGRILEAAFSADVDTLAAAAAVMLGRADLLFPSGVTRSAAVCKVALELARVARAMPGAGEAE